MLKLSSDLVFSEERDVCAPPVPGSPAQELPPGGQTAGAGNAGPDGPPAHFTHQGKPGKARDYFCPQLSHGAHEAVLISELSSANIVDRSSSGEEEEGRNTAGCAATSPRGEFRRVGSRVLCFVEEGSDQLDILSDAASDSEEKVFVIKSRQPRATRCCPPGVQAQQTPQLQAGDVVAQSRTLKMAENSTIEVTDHAEGPVMSQGAGFQARDRDNGNAEQVVEGAGVGSGAAVGSHIHGSLQALQRRATREGDPLLPRAPMPLSEVLASRPPGCRLSGADGRTLTPTTHREAAQRLKVSTYPVGYLVAEVPQLGSKAMIWHELLIHTSLLGACLHSQDPRSYFFKACDMKFVAAVKEESCNYAQLTMHVKGRQSGSTVKLTFSDPIQKAMFLEILKPFLLINEA